MCKVSTHRRQCTREGHVGCLFQLLSTSPFETVWTSCPTGPRILLSWLPPCWNYRCMLSLNSCILHGCWGSEPAPQISLASTLSITLSLPERVSEIQGSHCRCSHLTDEKLRPRPLTLEALCYPSQAITNISTSLGCWLCSECFLQHPFTFPPTLGGSQLSVPHLSGRKLAQRCEGNCPSSHSYSNWGPQKKPCGYSRAYRPLDHNWREKSCRLFRAKVIIDYLQALY